MAGPRSAPFLRAVPGHGHSLPGPWTRRPRPSPSVDEVADELDEEPHAEAAAALAGVGAVDVPGGAGDVDVRPRRVADEFLEEGRRGDRPRLALGGEVGEVGDRPLHHLLVLGVEGEAADQLEYKE